MQLSWWKVWPAFLRHLEMRPPKGRWACPFCSEYPCAKVLGIARGYVTMLADGQRMKAIGIDAWIQEQEERKQTGFAYADIRVLPYNIPG